MTIIDYISAYTIPSNPTISWIDKHAKTKTLRKDNLLQLHKDDFIFVVKGILKKVDDTDERVLHFVSERDFIIYPASGMGHSFVAVCPCALDYIHHHELLDLLSMDREMLGVYYKLLQHWSAQRLVAAELLRMPAPQRKKAFYEQFKAIAPYISNKDVASYLNITYSYFSKL